VIILFYTFHLNIVGNLNEQLSLRAVYCITFTDLLSSCGYLKLGQYEHHQNTGWTSFPEIQGGLFDSSVNKFIFSSMLLDAYKFVVGFFLLYL